MKKANTYLIILLSITLALFLIIKAPMFFSIDSSLDYSPKERAFLYREARQYMALLIAGTGFFFGMYLIYRRILLLEKTVAVTKETKISERFTKAIEQLGTYKLEVQLGGIYALEKIARESAKNHWTVIEILTAYVRENSPVHHNTNGQASANTIKRVTTDVQSILSVIGRRTWIQKERQELKVLNLRKTRLDGADLRRANLEIANLRGSTLRRVNFIEAELAGAFFGEADLSGANLQNANLQGANLVDAVLTGAVLKGADLRNANLANAVLQDVDLANVQMDGANLTGVDLSGAKLHNVSFLHVQLTKAKLNNVRYNYDTVFPHWVTHEMKEELRMAFETT